MEKVDPYLNRRIEIAKKHKVLGRIKLEEVPLAESNIELAHPIQLGSIGSFGWSHKSVENMINALENRYITYKPIERDRILIEFQPMENLPSQLGHVLELESLKRNLLDTSSVFGNSDSKEFSYLQTVDFAVEAYMDDEEHGKKYARIYINTEKLKQLRNVYLDPESLAETDYEYGYAFCVQGGIPKEAIDKIEVIKAVKSNYPFSINENEWIDNPDQEIQKQENRLKEYLKKFL